MILWFLRLFTRFRALEEVANEWQSGARESSLESDLEAARTRNVELEQENIRLQDRLEFAQLDRARVWDSFQTSLANERMSYQMQLNSQWQKQCGVVPFPDAPHLPDSHTPKASNLGPVGPGVRLASDIVARATNEYWNGKNRRHEEASGVAHEQAG